MNVILASDNGYAWLAGICMLSLFENNKQCEEINVWIFGDHISKENEDKLYETARMYGRKFELVDVNCLDIPAEICSGRYPKSAFSRLFAWKLLPENVHRVLYLDCDMVVEGNMEQLYNMDFEDKFIIACKDPVSVMYKWKVGAPTHGVYINTGMMMMDLDKFRSYPLIDKMKAFINKYASAMHYADQEIINGLFQGKFKILDSPKWNMMSQEYQYSYEQLRRTRHPHNYYTKQEILEAQKDVRVFHYTTCLLDIRPWFKNSKLKNADRFDKYMALSPWKDVEKKEMNFNNPKFKTIKMLFKLPTPVAHFCTGMLHAYLRPTYTILMNKIKGH